MLRNSCKAGVWWLLPLLAIGLTGCGGGGGGGGGSNQAPGGGTSAPTGSGNIPAQAPATPNNNSAFSTCPTAPAPNTGTAPANVGQPGIISGRVTFDRVPFFALFSINQTGPGLDYNSQQSYPARGVVVEAVVPTGQVCSGTVLDTAVTDGDGWYALSTAAAAGTTPVCVRARAQLFRSGTPNWSFAVADNTDGNNLYVMADSRMATAAAEPSRNLHAASGWSGGNYNAARVAAPFAILDTACTAMDTVLASKPATQFGNLTFFWSTRNTTEDGDVTQGKIGGPFFDPDHFAIYLRGDAAVNTDEFDQMVIAHEFGHFVTHTVSRSDSIGGSHSLFDKEDPRLAFDEGWATAFAGLVLQTSIYRDSDEQTSPANQSREFYFDIQATYPGVPKGWYAEASMQRVLYYIGAPGNVGGLDVGMAGLLQTLSGNYQQTTALASIFSFASFLKNDLPGDAGGIASLLDDEAINGSAIEPFASTETGSNALTGSDFPIYKELTVLGAGGAQTVCSTNNYGISNRLSNRRYIKFIPPSNGKYRFTVQPSPSLNGAVPGLELIDRGDYLEFQRNSTSTTLTVTTTDSLTAMQPYVLGIFHVGNAIDKSPVAPGDAKCLKVTAVVAP